MVLRAVLLVFNALRQVELSQKRKLEDIGEFNEAKKAKAGDTAD